eukprot:GHVP01021349.1.p1 GENE.GHVP01021349.1~~GHVP01021349.1.p1  ORF type:complete len:257 (+),score=21.16 GHVP01021349.1:55-825(+)
MRVKSQAGWFAALLCGLSCVCWIRSLNQPWQKQKFALSDDIKIEVTDWIGQTCPSVSVFGEPNRPSNDPFVLESPRNIRVNRALVADQIRGNLTLSQRILPMADPNYWTQNSELSDLDHEIDTDTNKRVEIMFLWRFLGVFAMRWSAILVAMVQSIALGVFLYTKSLPSDKTEQFLLIFNSLCLFGTTLGVLGLGFYYTSVGFASRPWVHALSAIVGITNWKLMLTETFLTGHVCALGGVLFGALAAIFHALTNLV